MSHEPVTRTVPLGRDEVLEFPRFALRVVRGPDAGSRVDFERRSVEIGADPRSDLRLTDPTVSRHHCVLEVGAQGYELRDLGSRNGTRIAGCSVRWALLAPGTVFEVGTTLVELEIAAARCRVELASAHSFGRMLGRSAAMRELYATLEKVARSDATVLLEAESGSGKELAAEAIHLRSAREEGPFEVFDCAAIPEHLAESELFGHEKGAFTGAVARSEGAFARADRGTLFLDEIGELPVSLQPKLLRVLDSRQVRPVGGSHAWRADVRIVAATNRDLAAMVSEGGFRLDLFHRLAVVRVRIPPLRHRPDDIPALVDHFVREHGGTPLRVSQEALARLQDYGWPGNVRELRNFVERGMILEEDLADLPFASLRAHESSAGAPWALPEADAPLPQYHAAKAQAVDEWERAYCERLLDRHGGNVSAAARAAGLNRKSLMYLLSKHDIRRYGR
jgi:transcriptional regulator with GAF, ATPase, and Fis domain